MAGVGPFSIPAAKNIGCKVWANDLNPASYSSLLDNIKSNKVQKSVFPFNLDGRTFIRQSFENLLKNENRTFDHVVMNLPATALEFLDAFIGVYNDFESTILDSVVSDSALNKAFLTSRNASSNKDPENKDQKTALSLKLPVIHVHCFSKSETPRDDILSRAVSYLNLPESICKEFGESAKLHYVRSVAPNKDMYCLSFELPLETALCKSKKR
ncbi:hypothetical protein BB560_002856 [Smittium megazygosporum]|uniref:SAM-dependent methyltransferase TRM5/TYW2-type domain-containing protein n=1 Tax=Smittium megazygosporum TaxID=133381 RepID=A0A2T9ZDN0_9FUNG|nr:hypothetical protein BB560_002856 [Smittium megazygosporum]